MRKILLTYETEELRQLVRDANKKILQGIKEQVKEIRLEIMKKKLINITKKTRDEIIGIMEKRKELFKGLKEKPAGTSIMREKKPKKPKGPVAPPRTKFNIKKNDPITDLTEFKKKEAEKKEPKKEPKKPPVPKRPPKPERVKAGVAKAPALELSLIHI